jgi:hypothetical protein
MSSENFREFPVSSNVADVAGELSDAQNAAVALLVSGKSFTRAAEALSVDVRTIYNWRKLPAFRRAMRARREEVWNEAADRLRAVLVRSMEVFEEFLHDRYDMHRFRAANAVLRHSGVRAALDPRGPSPSNKKRNG